MTAVTGFVSGEQVKLYGLGLPALLILEAACKRSVLYDADEHTGVFSRRFWALAKHEASASDLECLIGYLDPESNPERMLIDLITDLLWDPPANAVWNLTPKGACR